MFFFGISSFFREDLTAYTRAVSLFWLMVSRSGSVFCTCVNLYLFMRLFLPVCFLSLFVALTSFLYCFTRLILFVLTD